MRGSGFLAVYVAGIVLANGYVPYRAGVLRTHDAMAWLSQIVMFLVFGLLVFPRQLSSVALPGLALALLLAFVARPVLTLACLLPFKYSLREAGYVGGWDCAAQFRSCCPSIPYSSARRVPI